MKYVEDITGPRGEASIYSVDGDLIDHVFDVPHQYVVYCNGSHDGHYRTLHEARSAAHRAVGNG